MNIFNKQLKNKLKLRFYLYLESTKPPYQIRLLGIGITIFSAFLRLPQSLVRIMKNEADSGDFKSVFRRMWWLCNQLILKGKRRYDRYFDFSIGLDTEAAIAMYKRLERVYERSNRVKIFDHHIYLAQLVSAGIDGDIEPDEYLSLDTKILKRRDKSYVAHINSALSMLKKNELAGHKIHSKKRVEDLQTKPERNKTGRTNFSPRKNQFGEYAETVYAAFVKLLEDVNIPVFAISGTLLGIIRENAFLAHDYDIDLGVFEEVDFELLIATIDNSKLFYIKKADYPSFRERSKAGIIGYHRNAKPALLKIGHRGTGVHIDLFTHFHQNGVMWHGSTLHRWDNSPFTLTGRQFLGLEVLIPEDYDLYLSENYGDWQTPVTEFNCSTGTPNASISSNPRTLCYYIKLSFDSLQNADAYQGLIHTLLDSKLVLETNNTYLVKE